MDASLIPFNINRYVMVQLTDLGREICRKNRAEEKERLARLGASFLKSHFGGPPMENPDGWSRWQLWKLMEEFGPYLLLSQ